MNKLLLVLVLFSFVFGFYLGSEFEFDNANKREEFYKNIVELNSASDVTDVIVFLDVLDLLRSEGVNANKDKLISIIEYKVSEVISRNRMLGINKSRLESLYEDAKVYQSKYCENECLIKLNSEL